MTADTAQNLFEVKSERLGQRVLPVEYLKDISSKEVTVTTSTQTLEDLLGEALPATVMAVTLSPGVNSIRYNPVAAADATHAVLPAVFTIYGLKAVLDLAQFYAASSLDMGVIVHVPADE